MSLQFNGEGNGQDICSYADSLVKTNNTSFPLTEKARYANHAMREIWKTIFMAYGGWMFDDNNNTDLPIATTDLIKDQTFYTLPTDLSHIHGVEFLNNGGVWIPLSPMTMEKIHQRGYAESQFYSVSAVPLFYRPVANGFKIYPASNVTQSQSLRVHFSRDISGFVPGDTIKKPGFDPIFHEGVAIFMALQYAKINSLSSAGGTMKGGHRTGLSSDWYEFLEGVKKHYSERFRQMFPARMRVFDETKNYQ